MGGRRTALTRLAVSLAVLALLVTASGAGAQSSEPSGSPERQGKAPVLGTDDPSAIKGRYIVVLDKSTSQDSQRSLIQEAINKGAVVRETYADALKGFAARLPGPALNLVRNDPNVSYVEADMRVSGTDVQSPATWGLDRIDQRNLPLSNSYTYTATGAGVKAYIIDSGIRFSHNEFGGRATSGYDSVDGGSADDCAGHGTHVAGTVGGTTYGVAKSVSLIGVRVLDCNGNGTTSGVIAGVDWVTGNHAAGQPAVANMSLGGGASSSLDNAVTNSINDGVTYVIAAGNSNANACYESPGRVAAAVTVGSTTSSDARSSFSNYGSCLDLFAPGSSITSAWHTSNTATMVENGTSMASPHVAGVAALYLQSNPSASPATVANAINSSATTGVVTNPGSGSPNKLLYSLLTAAPPPPPPPSGCSLPESYSGSLAGTGDYDNHPNGTYYYSSVSGTHRGCLTGPSSGADFDLYLYKWNGFNWVVVAASESPTSTEEITYSGTSGYYMWEIYSYSGAGSYTFKMQRP